ncbi:MAG TPA: hypothetical protein VEW95_08990 [Candidatus Limnocylindrales bacterium]|nr:hypothetical protein [Candidatus Limnocylindrales bacterium]
MRVLFTSLPAMGHLNSILWVALAVHEPYTDPAGGARLTLIGPAATLHRLACPAGLPAMA